MNIHDIYITEKKDAYGNIIYVTILSIDDIVNSDNKLIHFESSDNTARNTLVDTDFLTKFS